MPRPLSMSDGWKEVLLIRFRWVVGRMACVFDLVNCLVSGLSFAIGKFVEVLAAANLGLNGILCRVGE